jgi:hypothetical protein
MKTEKKYREYGCELRAIGYIYIYIYIYIYTLYIYIYIYTVRDEKPFSSRNRTGNVNRNRIPVFLRKGKILDTAISRN